MLIARLSDCTEFLARDHTILRELLHPAKSGANVGYSLAHGTLAPGTRSKRHRLRSSEVYYFIAGRGTFWIGEESAPIGQGTVVFVPVGAVQWVENIGTTAIEFLCLVDPAWRSEDEEVLE
jgi:mannose-6-phosphate isomerase-like protein (cupin superfamily)